jgi:LuxR family maltose regulon positive regulatory protein
MIGYILMLYNKETFPEYFQRASEHLPEGASVRLWHMMRIDNNNILSMEDNMPGALRRMERAMSSAAPYLTRAAGRICTGGGAARDNGFAELFSAEAGYSTMDFVSAKQHAFTAFYAAREARRHDIVCNARFVFAKIALIQGNLAELSSHVEFVRNYINELGDVSLRDLRECVVSWMHLMIGGSEDISPWIINECTGWREQPPIRRGRERFLYAIYLTRLGRYDELLALLDRLEEFCARRGLWNDRLNVHILRAIGHMKLQNRSDALESLWLAYDMSHNNNIVAPFVEFGTCMRALIDNARRYPAGGRAFDPVWLDNVYRKVNAFSKRQLTMTKEFQRRNFEKYVGAGGDMSVRAGVTSMSGAAGMTGTDGMAGISGGIGRGGNGGGAIVQGIKLSKRELEILHSLSQGLTRQDIADASQISVNTAKSTITNVYNKLGAINRADAVRIAASLGILE